MTEYDERAARKLYEEHGAVGFKHFLKHHAVSETVEHFKNYFKLETLKEFGEGLYEEGRTAVIGLTGLTVLIIGYLTALVWLPFYNVYRAYKLNKIYQSFLEDEDLK